MRGLYFAATSCLLVTLITGVSVGQTSVQSNRQLLADLSPASSVSSNGPSAVELDSLFDPVPISAIPATNAAGCAAPASAASSTVPPAPVPAAPAPRSAALPNSDAMPLTAAFARPVTPARPPDSRKRFFISNTVMYGATVLHAFGRQAEIDACIREEPLKNGVFSGGSYKGQAPDTAAKFYAISLPIDAGVTLLSALARHKGWRSFEIAAPLSAATAHITAGAFKFSSGCY